MGNKIIKIMALNSGKNILKL